MVRFSRKRIRALACSLIASACILAAGSIAPAETFSFANGYDGWTPFTNDGNPANGWESRNGCLIQMAANDDATPFGDRYLIRENALNLGAEVGSYIETATDVMLVDYRGGNMVWQGLNLFVDSANPAQPGNVAVIYERNEDDNQNGLRVHCDGWSSDMAPVEVKDFNWYRLKTRVERW